MYNDVWGCAEILPVDVTIYGQMQPKDGAIGKLTKGTMKRIVTTVSGAKPTGKIS